MDLLSLIKKRVEEIPNCPTNIKKIRRNLIKEFALAVIPVDKPAVPKAEQVSKIISTTLGILSAIFSNTNTIIREKMTIKNNAKEKTAVA